jgi:MoxR-like ATPase
MKKRILDFNSFVNESYQVNEGIIDKITSFFKKATGWVASIYQAIKDGNVPKITSGPDTGKPAVMIFDPENGSIVDQMKDFYISASSTEVNEAKIPLEYTGEDQSVRNISAEDLKNDVVKLYRSKSRGGRAKPIFIYGAPGIGKTEIVGQAGDELGVKVIKLDLQFMNPEDFLGIPSRHDVRPVEIEAGKLIDPGYGFTRSNPPRLLPPDNGKEGKGGIIFMDEMNRANKITLNSIMQFVQQGRIGEYELPDKWVIVAAGNRPEEAEGVADFDFALADRFTIKNYVPTVERWVSWAEKNEKILPELVTFLTFNKDLFHHLDTEKKVLNYPTPRSWTDAALILSDEITDTGAKSWRDLPIKDIENIFYDQVGPEASKRFVDYLDVLKKISDSEIDQILNDPDNARIIEEGLKQKSILYGLMEMVLKRVDTYSTQKLYNVMTYFNRYNQLDPLSWLYKTTLIRYPEFKFGGSGPEENLKVDAAKLVTKQAKDRGLQP